MKVIRTTEGYMVELDNGDYLCDMHDDNTWDTRAEAEDVIDHAQGKQKKTWAEFNRLRFHPPVGFYGCVAPDGTWFDSSASFEIAVHWCCCQAGHHELTNEIEWMSTEGVKLGYSVIHSSMLEKMYEKGLIK
jgi:hypothetical protein